MSENKPKIPTDLFIEAAQFVAIAAENERKFYPYTEEFGTPALLRGLRSFYFITALLEDWEEAHKDASFSCVSFDFEFIPAYLRANVSTSGKKILLKDGRANRIKNVLEKLQEEDKTTPAVIHPESSVRCMSVISDLRRICKAQETLTTHEVPYWVFGIIGIDRLEHHAFAHLSGLLFGSDRIGFTCKADTAGNVVILPPLEGQFKPHNAALFASESMKEHKATDDYLCIVGDGVAYIATADGYSEHSLAAWLYRQIKLHQYRAERRGNMMHKTYDAAYRAIERTISLGNEPAETVEGILDICKDASVCANNVISLVSEQQVVSTHTAKVAKLQELVVGKIQALNSLPCCKPEGGDDELL